MTIQKKLKILELLFKTLDGEELTEEHVDQALESLVHSPVKRARYKANMVEKYGPDVFRKRGESLLRKESNE